METKVNFAAVGVFVLFLGACLVVGALWLASGGALQKKYDLYLAIEDESVAGLNPDAPVKYNGVDVGKVRQITLDHEDPQRVRLLFAIERGTPLREDTVAVLKTQGLTGIAYVELSGGSRDSPPLRPPAQGELAVIRTKPSLGARLENVLTDVLAKLDHTSGNLDALLSAENRAAFTSVLADSAAIAKAIAGRKEDLQAGITAARRTFDQTALAATQLGPVIERIGRGADAVGEMGAQAGLASTQAAETFAAVGADVQRFTGETLPELERLLGELRALSGSLRRVTEQTERDPSGLLFGRRPVPDGPGETRSGDQTP